MTTVDLTARRRRAEETLRSTCVITRPAAGPAVVDPVTHVAVQPPPVTVWSGPCSLAPMSSTATAERAGRQLEGRDGRLSVPVAGTDTVLRGDTVTVTGHVGPDDDPALIGIPWTVDESATRTRMVLRRLRVVDTRGTDGRLP